MNWIETFAAVLTAAGIKLAVLVSSVIGGFLSLRFFEGEQLADGSCRPLPTKQKWFIAASGAAMGVYLSGFAVEFFALTDKTGKIEVGLGLAIAVFGMSLASAIVRALKELNLGGVIESWLTRR